jgi:hypothetical protein
MSLFFSALVCELKSDSEKGSTAFTGYRRQQVSFQIAPLMLRAKENRYRIANKASNKPLPILSLVTGILILVVPRLLSYIIAMYLIITVLVGLFGRAEYHLR